MSDEAITTEDTADEMKVGARHTRKEIEAFQAVHDIMVSNGAKCAEPMKNVDPDALAYFGDTVKALGDGKVGGYLVRYSGAADPDLTEDYFDARTDIHAPDTLPVLYQHGFDAKLGKRVIGKATTGRDDVGLWIEAQLDMRDEYEKAIYALAEKGKLGWSSGALSHLVERERTGNASRIKSWFIGEASLTPTPAEPRNSVVPLKSLSVDTQVETKQGAQDKREAEATPDTNTQSNQGVKTMELTPEQLQEMVTQAAEAGAKKAIEATEPVKTAGVQVTVVTDEADRPFKSLAEQCIAVRDYYKSLGRKVHPRIKGLFAHETKAVQGASEGVPGDGGVLLEPTIAPEVLKPVHEEGPFTAATSKLPVQSNSNSGWINGVDETSRATGSRWGGVRGYRLAEGDTITKSKPKFRRIQWELKKYGALVYDTNELLKDAGQFSAVVQQACREEISFMVNDDIFRGLGVAGLLGIMNSGALVSVTRTDANTIKGSDISNMWARLSARSKKNARWYINGECGPQLDALFAVGSTAVLFPFAGYTNEGVRTLYGRPVEETEFNEALGTSGDILLADMGEYLQWEKGDIEYATSMHVEFLTDQEVMRFIYRADGQPVLASPITPYKGSLTRSPFVALTAAS